MAHTINPNTRKAERQVDFLEFEVSLVDTDKPCGCLDVLVPSESGSLVCEPALSDMLSLSYVTQLLS